jgi:hypothetical protein
MGREERVAIVEDEIKQGNALCDLCGGVITVTWTMIFEEGRPRTLRAYPTQFLKMCGGHPHATVEAEHARLSDEQKYSMRMLRQRMQSHFGAEIDAMRLRYPELKLEYDFHIDALLHEREGDSGSAAQGRD